MIGSLVVYQRQCFAPCRNLSLKHRCRFWAASKIQNSSQFTISSVISNFGTKMKPFFYFGMMILGYINKNIMDMHFRKITFKNQV